MSRNGEHAHEVVRALQGNQSLVSTMAVAEG